MPLKVPKHAEEYKQRGNDLFAKEKFNAAIEAYTEARLACPKWPVPLVNRALCHRKRGDWTACATDCRKALELDSELPKAHYMLGLALLEEEEYTEAVKTLSKALELARDRGATMLDEIWKELARAKYNVWIREATLRADKLEKVQKRAEYCMQMCAINDVQAAQQRHASQEDIEHIEREYQLNSEELSAAYRLARKDDVPTEIPDWCICKLTMEPYRDPVQTPAGFTYERSALWEHFKKLGHFDPVTRSQISPDQCASNTALRAATRAYLDSHGWAWGEYLSSPEPPSEALKRYRERTAAATSK